MLRTHSRHFSAVVSLLLGLNILATGSATGQRAGTRRPPQQNENSSSINPSGVPFKVRLETAGTDALFKGVPRLQSFAFAQSGGRWVLIGGRTNGFHGFGPDANFPYSSANTSIWVVDTTAKPAFKTYEYKLSNLPATLSAVRDQFSSTNMQSYQDGNNLYLIGGYGITSAGTGNLVTYSMLTWVDTDRLIKGVMSGNQSDVPNAIKFSNDTTKRLQVTGGELLKLDDDFFYLVVGQVFNGPYMDCVTGKPTCQQQYTDEIRKFKIKTDASGNPIIDDGGGTTTSPSTYTAFNDPANLHRRDLNVTPTILADGTEGVGVYAGVFIPPDADNPDANFPWRYPVYLGTGVPPPQHRIIKTHPADLSVRINPNAVVPGNPAAVKPFVDYTFEQRMSPYACASVLMYDPGQRAMYTTLFGGIGHFVVDDDGQTIISAGGPPGAMQDPAEPRNPKAQIFNDRVPFIPYITTIVRDRNSRTSEVVHATRMPGFDVAANKLPIFLGAESRFIPDPSTMNLLYTGSKEIFDFSKLMVGQEKYIGYIYGGIQAQPNKSSNGYIYRDWKKYGQFTTTISTVAMRVYVTRNR